MNLIDPHDSALFSDRIDTSHVITLTAHTHPDGDALGSTVALCRYLRACRGKDAAIVLPDPIPETIRFMQADDAPLITASEAPEAAAARIAGSDLLISLDYNAFSRTEQLESLLATSPAGKILIDHHLAPDTAAFPLRFSTPDISSTCELLFWLLLSQPDIAGDAAKLPEDCRTALLAGMTTDTNNFANSVFPSTFEMASALLEAGTDRDAVLTELYNRGRENRLRLIGYLLGEKLRITPEGGAVMVLTEEERARFDICEGETEGIVNIPLSVDGVRMVIFLKQYVQEHDFHISIRSKRGTSAVRFAREFFHGGGHENAAGGRLYYPQDIASPEDAEAYVLDRFAAFLR